MQAKEFVKSVGVSCLSQSRPYAIDFKKKCMDHSQSQISGVEEGCSSSESGWTDYLVSPVNSGDEEMIYDFQSDGSGDSNGGKNNRNNRKGDDNDSLASDASSGTPSHQKRVGKNRNSKGKEEGGSGMEHGSVNSSKCSYKNNEEKKAGERSKPDSHRKDSGTYLFHGGKGVARKK